MLPETVDVVVIGAGNAAMCAALAAREEGASVLVLERAPEDERGGNTRFTAGAIRCVYDGVDDLKALMPDLTNEEIANTDFGTYTAEKFHDDMGRVTEYRANPDLVELLVDRSRPTLRWMRGKGVRRVILGTAAVRDPQLVRDACRAFPGRVAVGIDAREGRVAVAGWAEESNVMAIDLARRFEDAGVAAIIFTDIGRDGALGGLNLDATVALARSVSIPVIASGGLASMADIEALLKPEHTVLEGAITGRALYDGRIEPAKALALIAAADSAVGSRSAPARGT